MTASPTIKRTPPPTAGMDFWQLRREGMEYIIRLGSDFWTDYNIHDPGITTLEVLCYAITDLSYRANLPIGDLLATESGKVAPAGMPLATEMLTCNPVTFDDFRKLLIDIDGVKNAWVRKAPPNTEGSLKFGISTIGLNRVLAKPSTVDPKVELIRLNGLYEILIDFDDQTDCCPPEEALQAVKATLLQYRNLCEDYMHIGLVETVDINICSAIEVEEDVDVNAITAEILYRLQEFMTPMVPFHSLAQMLERKKTASFDEIFDGVLLQNGFIDDEELAAADLRQTLYVSDLYNIIGDVDGVKSVKGVRLSKKNTSPLPTSPKWQSWELPLFAANETPRKPILTLKGSQLKFKKRGIEINTNQAVIEEKLSVLRALNGPLSMRGKNGIDYPNVTVRPDLTDYFTIQNEFPHVYHVGKEGIEREATPERKAQVKQLKAYLTFFDQILTNYLGYLANVKNVLSIDQPTDLPTRFSQPLYKDVPFISDLLPDMPLVFDPQTSKSKPYDDFLKTGLETETEKMQQKNSILNHLIARFAETFSDFAMNRYYDDLRTPDADDYFIRLTQNTADKARFTHQIPEIGRNRGKGFDYQKHIKNKPDVWNTDNVEGLKKRVSALLGVPNAERKTLTCPPSHKLVRFTASEGKRGLAFVLTDPNDKPLLQSFTPQPTEDRRRLQIKETIDAVTADVIFKKLAEFKPQIQGFEDNKISETKGLLHIDENLSSKTVYRFGNAINNNIFLQRDPTNDSFWWFMVENEEHKIVAQSATPFTKLGEAYNFLLKLEEVFLNNPCDSEGFHVVEHILLRPRCEDCLDGKKAAIDMRKCLNRHVPSIQGTPQYPNDISDPYSFWITVVASQNWKRFYSPTNQTNQTYFEQTLRAETPAHIGVRICWLTNEEMFDFETAYGTWLIELAAHTPDRCAVDEAAQNLVKVMNGLTCNCCDNTLEDNALPCEPPILRDQS